MVVIHSGLFNDSLADQAMPIQLDMSENNVDYEHCLGEGDGKVSTLDSAPS